MGKTSIEWATDTWNPVRARRKSDGRVGWHCEKISAGCAHCYAETFNGRRLPGGGTGLPYGIRQRGVVETFVDNAVLSEPLSWRKPRRVFVCSMTDLFGEWVPDEAIDDVLATTAVPECNRHTFMVLTKRAQRMREYFSAAPARPGGMWPLDGEWPLANVWLGVSVEDQRAANERIPELLATPAAVRFVSTEPLLGEVDLSQWTVQRAGVTDPDQDAPDGAVVDGMQRVGGEWKRNIGLDWVIVGGESGPGARPCYVEHVRSIVEQTRAAGVACFVKQLGARCYSMPYRGSDRKWTPEEALDPNGEAIEELGKILGASRQLMLHGKGGDPAEWPEDLRVREFPR